MATNTTRLKTLAIAFATIAPIVAGVSVVSMGTASASLGQTPRLRSGRTGE